MIRLLVLGESCEGQSCTSSEHSGGSLCLCDLELLFVAFSWMWSLQKHIQELFIFTLQWPWLPEVPGSCGWQRNRLVEPRQERGASQSLSLSLPPSLLSLLLFFFCHPLPSTSTKAVAIAMKHSRNVLNLTFTLSAILAYDPYHIYLYFYSTCLLMLLIRMTGTYCVGLLTYLYKCVTKM